MEFTMRKDIDEYSIEEQGRCVFRASYEKEEMCIRDSSMP